MKTIRRRLTYANVVSTLALIAAIGGGTTAIAGSGKVGGRDLKPIVVREASDPNPGDPESDYAKATCLKGEKRTGGTAFMTGPGAGGPVKNGWAASDHTNLGVTALALCLTK